MDSLVPQEGLAPTPVSKSDLLAHAWLDRDLSWLNFNRRVLHEALDERTPLLERCKFLANVTSNLDEFFMKRMGVLRGKARSKAEEDPVNQGRPSTEPWRRSAGP